MSIDRWQAWLALEHEAVWTYSTVAARHSDLREMGRAAEEAHRAARDQLVRRIRKAGGEPVGTQAAYGPDTSTQKLSRRAARDLERRIAAECLRAVEETAGPDRRFSVTGLSRAALADLGWGSPPSAFPGATPTPR